MNSDLLFSKFFRCAFMITSFSDKQRSHLLVPHLYGDAWAAILHFMLCLILLSFRFQMNFDSSVSLRYLVCLNDLVWLLYLDLNSLSDAP